MTSRTTPPAASAARVSGTERVSPASAASRLSLPDCPCTEPEASGEDWPGNMHVHAECRVYHRGKDCGAGQGVLPL